MNTSLISKIFIRVHMLVLVLYLIYNFCNTKERVMGTLNQPKYMI